MTWLSLGAAVALVVMAAGCATADSAPSGAAPRASEDRPAPSRGSASAAGGAPADASVGVPSWAMHVKAAPIDPQMPLATAIARLTREMGQPGLADGHLAAEQIALAALHSLDAGEVSDAALLLSIASYRYDQQQQHISETGYYGESKAPYKTNTSVYFKLLKRELAIYQSLSFWAEAQSLAAWRRGDESAPGPDLHGRLANLFTSWPADERTFRERPRKRRAGPHANADQAVQAVALAEGFLARLRADAANKLTEYSAISAMARTRMAAFSAEALRLIWLPFSPEIADVIAEQLGGRLQIAVPLLAAPKPATRAFAAVVLAMGGSVDQIAALDQRLAIETDPSVRVSLAYALTRLGRRERVADLVAVSRSCSGDLCDHTVKLLQWLPNDFNGALDQQALAAIAADGHHHRVIRSNAAAILRDLAAGTPLDAPTRDALFVAAGARDPDLTLMSAAAIARDASFSRDQVLALLAAPSPAYRPLLARLARVATPADLPLLARLMPQFAQGEIAEAQSLVSAAASLPGTDADAQLLAWFDAHPAIRPVIALSLIARPGTPAATLHRMSERGDASIGLLIQAATGAPELIATLDRVMHTGAPGDRLLAARVAGELRDRRAIAALTSLITFQDARYYPQDVLVRHAAIASLLKIAIAARRP